MKVEQDNVTPQGVYIVFEVETSFGVGASRYDSFKEIVNTTMTFGVDALLNDKIRLNFGLDNIFTEQPGR